jgi:hypothetical protein
MANKRYNLPEDTRLDEIVKDLRKRVEDAERLTRVRVTSIDRGALALLDADGGIMAVFGDLDALGITNGNDPGNGFVRPDGEPQMGIVYWRDDGTFAFSIFDHDPTGADGYNQFWALWDRLGHPVVMDDFVHGFGLARPVIPVSNWLPLNPVGGAGWPISGTDWTNLWETTYVIQHGTLWLAALMYSDAGTSGQVRVTINGTQLGTATTGGAGYTQHIIQEDVRDYGYGSFVTLRLQARRTVGSGNVRAAPRAGYGLQSS